MVDFIDIHSLNIEELDGVVSIYPWFAAARKELCVRMADMGALTETQIAQTALYLGSRGIAYRMAHSGKGGDISDKDARSLFASCLPPVEGTAEKKVYVVGGDYFSREQYDGVRKSEDSVFSRFAAKAREDGYSEAEPEQTADFCTETLARIYLEQDYKEEAIDIYSKLSLRYPEKSVYFAALIDEIKQKQ